MFLSQCQTIISEEFSYHENHNLFNIVSEPEPSEPYYEEIKDEEEISDEDSVNPFKGLEEIAD